MENKNQQPNTSARLYNLLYTAIQCIYIMKQIKIWCCNLLLDSPCPKVAHMGFHLLLSSEAGQDKPGREDVGLSGTALHNKSSKCQVLIPHRQLDNLSAQHIQKTLYRPMFDAYQQVNRAQDSLPHGILIPIYGSNIHLKNSV